jgi:dTDP-4-amino-4,6-dideoxygalactose transaminase
MKRIPVTRPYMDEAEVEAAAQAIRSGWIAQGPKVAEFEAACAARVGARHAVAVTNCTSALHLALVCLGIGAGDDVLVPSLSFIASANAIRHAGARPVFVDIDPRTYNLDSDLLARTLTPRTRAIMIVDQIGLPADLDPILDFAGRRGLAVVEDAAPALGAIYRGRAIGSISPATCFSFHPRKSISTGEGGLIATNDAELADRARRLRSHGASISDLARHKADMVVTEDYVEVGYNYRMTDIQAAIGIEQLKKLDFILERRRQLASRYAALLSDVVGVTPPLVPEYAEHTFQSYAIRVDPAVASRDGVMAAMLRRGVATRRGVMAIHESAAYARTVEGSVSLPITEAATRQTLLLPIYTDMADEDQDYVAGALVESMSEAKA